MTSSVSLENLDSSEKIFDLSWDGTRVIAIASLQR